MKARPREWKKAPTSHILLLLYIFSDSLFSLVPVISVGRTVGSLGK